MDKESLSLEESIKKNYKAVQNYLNEDPGAKGFLNSLADLQTDFANYLIEILKTKKYGKDDVKKSNIYQGHIKGGEYKYIDSEKLEPREKLKRIEKLEYAVSTRVLGEKVSINSLLNEGIKKIKELFDTQKAFEQRKIFKLEDIILPPDPDELAAPITGSGGGLERKNLSQNKFRLFISILREIGICDDDLIIYSGKVDKNMMRENTYYAIFIPRINKTVFLNTGYGEATFVCEGVVSIDKMTTLGKKELQSELGAIKINFFENNIEGWKNELKISLSPKTSDLKDNIDKKKKKIADIKQIKRFYERYKKFKFKDSEGRESTIQNLFSTEDYYHKNYEIINNDDRFGIKLPAKPRASYGMKRNDLKTELKAPTFATIAEIEHFYKKYASEDIVNKLFSSASAFSENYEIINNDDKFGIKLPANPCTYYDMSRNEFKKEIGIPNLATIEQIKNFYDRLKNKNDELKIIDNEGNEITVDLLFYSLINYAKYYVLINNDKRFGIKLPADIPGHFGITRGTFKEKITGIKKKEIATIEQIRDFYNQHKGDYLKDSEGNEIMDNKGNKITVELLFSNITYYQSYYKEAKNLGIILPSLKIIYKKKGAWNNFTNYIHK